MFPQSNPLSQKEGERGDLRGEALGEGRERRAARAWVGLAMWLVAIVAALGVDRTVAGWMYAMRPAVPRHGIEVQHGPLSREDVAAKIVRLPGVFYCTLAVAAALLVVHRDRWRAAGFVLVVAVLSAGVNHALKWGFGRLRPMREGAQWDAFSGGWYGLMHLKPDVTLPSGHTSLAFATATALSVISPRYRAWFYGVAALVGLERVAENAHYVSDVVVAALVGWGCAQAVAWAFDGRRGCARGR
jgi:membrane-associated phospholipid phosphatase